jgi:uncharacterized surface protein with fasciclin (FAS1) repeats
LKIILRAVKLLRAPIRSYYKRRDWPTAQTGDGFMKSAFFGGVAALALSTSFALADGHSKTIVEIAVGSADHTTLVAAVQAAGLAETLSGAGPFTLFAPTNDAFAKLPAGTVDTLLLPENKDQLTKILTCHAVAASAMAADVLGMIEAGGGTAKVGTVGGCELSVTTADGKVNITDEMGNVATVTAADLAGSNGVVHVIDTVLLPKS